MAARGHALHNQRVESSEGTSAMLDQLLSAQGLLRDLGNVLPPAEF